MQNWQRAPSKIELHEMTQVWLVNRNIGSPKPMIGHLAPRAKLVTFWGDTPQGLHSDGHPTQLQQSAWSLVLRWSQDPPKGDSL